MFEFEEFPKIARLKRTVFITEKVDGTNAQIKWVPIPLDQEIAFTSSDPNVILTKTTPEGIAMALLCGRRTGWIQREGPDNYGFRAWCIAHADDLFKLGEGSHFGEWYGLGIQRGYDLPDKRFALFNTVRWNPNNPNKPDCCGVVPVLAFGENVDDDKVMGDLDAGGSVIAPGYKNPEGIVIYHTASRQLYKRTFKDDGGKWKKAQQGIAA